MPACVLPVAGKLSLCASAAQWVAPAAADAGKKDKKKKGGAGDAAAAQPAAGAADEELDPEKAAKKVCRGSGLGRWVFNVCGPWKGCGQTAYVVLG